MQPFFLISSMVLDFLDQLQIFWQLHLNLIELPGTLTGLRLFKLQHLIYPRLLTRFDMLVYFTNKSLLELPTNLPYDNVWNIVFMSGLVLLVATWNCQVSYKSRYAGLFVLHLLPVLNPWLIVEMSPAYGSSIGITLVDVWSLPYSGGRSTRYFDRLHEFSVTISRSYKDVYVNNFFSRTAIP